MDYLKACLSFLAITAACCIPYFVGDMPNLNRWQSALVTISVVVIFFLIRNSIVNYKKVKVHELVSWCLLEFPFGGGSPKTANLIPYIKSAQSDYIDVKYQIESEEEWQYAESILSAFQKDIFQRLLCNGIPYRSHLTASQPYVEFFMFRLFVFLSDNQEELNAHKTFNADIFTKLIPCDKSFVRRYELSCFGRVLIKMRYISHAACQRSDVYKKKVPAQITPEYYTDHLDNNYVDHYVY